MIVHDCKLFYMVLHGFTWFYLIVHSCTLGCVIQMIMSFELLETYTLLCMGITKRKKVFLEKLTKYVMFY